MFKKILVANRGEIALRVIRSCYELGVRSVAVYSEADKDSLHVQLADEAICIGPALATESYLKIPNIISAAEITDVDAIHPGYGFLAENAHFAEVCENCNITFIGPSADTIRKMGNKAAARKTMKESGVPITPGSDGVLKNKDEALELAREMGYPVLIKAVSGGGGKGMRIAHNDVSLAQAFMTASAEADQAFGDPDLYLEKYVSDARHIEVQVLGDKHGHAVHLGERDCSIQRNHQKLIEESPCPVLSARQRKKICDIAVKATKAVNYSSAGTFEFLYDENEKSFYFMEMNTRIQVEHPVSEEVSGIDLIKEQIRSAAGEPLAFSQRKINLQGHAIEFRVNAEDPYKNFTPSPCKIDWMHMPSGLGVRIESHAYTGYQISPHYDSMISKLIVKANTRKEAIARMVRALDEFTVDGPATTLPLGICLFNDECFCKGDYNTGFLPKFLESTFLAGN